MAQIQTTLGQHSVNVGGTTALTATDSADWNDVDSEAKSDRQIEIVNCGATDLFVSLYNVSNPVPNAAAVRAAFYRQIPPGSYSGITLKGGEALRVVRAVGAAVETVVAKIRVIRGGI
ncbi:hypothetical protein EON81_19705 [bacterium]|nr:MAG: hypothetical protein EON81_19705 [bacterium]